MNDRFKFRVWDIGEKRYIENTGNPFIFPFNGNVAMQCAGSSHGYIDDEDHSEFYQIEFCTGLKDKKGKLTYEGDVVKFNDGLICEVAWHENECAFNCYEINGSIYRGCEHMRGLIFEVIGNIHENSDLLR